MFEEIKKIITEFEKNLADVLCCRLVCIGNALDVSGRFRYDVKCVPDAKIEDWLYLIANSISVMANSFPALCFAIIFGRQCISFVNYSLDRIQHRRMESLLLSDGQKEAEEL